ncbi:hypothetical protein FOL47_004212 [Perkinsus chesapeaki]|uniref:Uncharacterized protein n=1 Tax=Perkinsus chesapeaki TaxID=330153 RepID=A0A7J6M418_PERCH|nr:hypothetical protein FOL47_004212 [Perkinsus chesapeaki]
MRIGLTKSKEKDFDGILNVMPNGTEASHEYFWNRGTDYCVFKIKYGNEAFRVRIGGGHSQQHAVLNELVTEAWPGLKGVPHNIVDVEGNIVMEKKDDTKNKTDSVTENYPELTPDPSGLFLEFKLSVELVTTLANRLHRRPNEDIHVRYFLVKSNRIVPRNIVNVTNNDEEIYLRGLLASDFPNDGTAISDSDVSIISHASDDSPAANDANDVDSMSE